MRSFYRKLKIFGVCAILSVSLTACNFFNHQDVVNNNQNNESFVENNGYYEDNNNLSNDVQTPINSYTIAELKEEFAVLGVSSNYTFRPFYNVEQTTEFTFHFNSMVDPVKAVTVHTDEKCEEASTVNQLNDGYRVVNGVDVVVKPGKTVLSAEGRKDEVKEGIWGYAPIYYLCIRYDLDSTTVKKLDEPIIVPFTIRNEISTPNAYANIGEDGTFRVKWFGVDDAVSYNIYQSYFGSIDDPNKVLSAEERAYTKTSLKLLKSVDSSTLEYVPEADETGSLKVEDDTVISDSGYVTRQNDNDSYVYCITAVDSNGNESFFSKVIEPYRYLDIMPNKIETKSLGESDTKGYINEFKDTVKVIQCDGKTLVNYPVNYYKLKVSPLNDKCTYRYEIVGTKLTGEITYYNADGEFPEEVISKAKLKKGALIETQKETIPSVDTDTMYDEAYKNAKIDLKSATTYPEGAKIQLDPASLIVRADLEASRLFGDGTYAKSLDTIDSYVLNDNPEWIVVKSPNGVIEVIRNENYSSTPEVEKPIEQEKAEEAEKPVEQEKPAELEKPVEQEKPAEPEKNYEPDTEINNNNYVDEQRKSTEKQVKEADKETIEKTDYPVFAETAGQKYLALSLINQVEAISLKAFPEYQDRNELFDDLLYVWYQNPYIMGINPNELKTSRDGLILYPSYNVNKTTAERYQEEIAKKAESVVNKIITSEMSEQEKAVKIYTYLQENAEYNHAAFDYAQSGGEDFYKKYSNSWNTYGILCEGLGVCQSYAYAFNILAYEADVDSIMVTGTMNNGGHAWNAVKINNIWYMLDSTNNIKASGVPYWVCNSSTDFIFENGFTFWDTFVDGTNTSEFKKNDETKDWYYAAGLFAESPEKCADIWCKQKNTSDDVYIKYSVTQETVSDFSERFVKQAAKNGASQSELQNLKLMSFSGIIMLTTK